MANTKKLLSWAIGIVLIAYVAVAFTPMKATIGRHNPDAASLFSPVLFNFSHTYTSGNVLEFAVGMKREELLQTLRHEYSGEADLIVDCVVTTAESVVPITSDLDVAAAYGGGERLCARLDSQRLGIFVEFEDNLVSTIKVVLVRNETP